MVVSGLYRSRPLKMASMLAGRVSHLSIATPIVTDDMMREGVDLRLVLMRDKIED